jgi:hypothetical protein
MTKTRINEKGYLVFLDSGNLYHRWRAKKKYGPEWREDFEVHHIDGDKLNNDDYNLIQLSREDHHNLHQHKNKEDLLSGLIIACSLVYLLAAALFGFIFTSLISEGVYIMRASVVIILVLAIELKTNIIAKTVRRPHERVFKELKD